MGARSPAIRSAATCCAGSTAATRESGENALIVGGIVAVISAATAMGQIERGSNRIYGVERDRPPLRKYGLAALLAATAGVATILAFLLLVPGGARGTVATG